MTGKVYENLIQPIISRKGTPTWQANGRNMGMILNDWELAFDEYNGEQLQNAARAYCMNTKLKSFPEIEHLREFLKIGVSPKGKSNQDAYKLPEGLYGHYSDFANWFNNIMGRVYNQEPKYPELLSLRKGDIIDDVVEQFVGENPGMKKNYEDYDWRVYYALAWKNGLLPRNAEREMAGV